MFDKNFYPTPDDIADSMIALLDDDAQYILDPEAGAGALLDAYRRLRKYKDLKLYAIEQNPDLVSILRGKDYQVISFDFLSYQPSNFFDVIIMNPPFDNGAEHLLHAIEIMKNGEIVCLLNSETIKNPFSKERRFLSRRIFELGGTVKHLGQVFKDSERPTDAEVSLVYIKMKAEKTDGFEYWQEISKEKDNGGSNVSGVELTHADQVEALVSSFNQVQKDVFDGFRSLQRAFYLQTGIVGIDQTVLEESIKTLRKGIDDPRNAYNRAVNGFVDNFRKDAWKQVFARTGADKLMSRKVRERFEIDLSRGSSMDFTVENIHGVVHGLMQDSAKILRESISDIFDHLCSFDEKNKVHIEGWKTNSAYKVNKRVILPYLIELFMGSFSTRYSYSGTPVVEDLDKILCRLSGKKIESIQTTVDSLNKRFKELRDPHDSGEFKCESEFFHVKFYKKGTVHLKWKDERLWAAFNIEAAKGKNWIGSDGKEDTSYTTKLMIESKE